MAEELIEFCYAGLAKGRDVALSLLAGGLVGIAAHVLFDGPEQIEAFVVGSGGACLLGVFVLGQSRWRAHGRLSESSIATSHGADGAWTELSLDAIEEIRLFADGSLDFIGAGVRVRVSGEMDGAAKVRERLLSRRGFGLFDRLRDAYARGETLEFRGPRDPRIALYAAGLYAAFLGVPMVVMLARSSVVLPLLLGLVLVRLLYREAWSSMEVALEPGGLRRRFGPWTRRYPWASIRGARLHDKGALLITLADGSRAAFPPALSNFVVLQEIVLAGPPSTS